MKKIIHGILLLVAIIFLFTYCDYHVNDDYYDNTPPDPPKNVRTYMGDGKIEIEWDSNRERDLAGYNVYYSTSYWGTYKLIGNTSGTYFVDSEAKNGELYYYGVAAYDYDGNESELSYDKVFGIARPEGLNQTIFDYLKFPNTSGYDFSNYAVVSYNANTETESADIFFENYEGNFFLNVWEDSDIQDMGATNSILDIPEAPTSGWVQLKPDENIKYVELIEGHTYVIWTHDNHFAKVRVNYISNERIKFDWAYQLVKGETLLKTNRTSRNFANTERTVRKKK
ncbi:MAG: hypothetical protein CR986_04140 [Ignavibacteriae bacterium]|nr:MAG: hypothetical protein CR986_04140 [Ignavibacteriota bacterium]